ncbi:hypothetical protein MNB_SM-5-920 [hydrothermal vent metagenome]|uniref:Uncharacterized protein n=1 Tax=hydrothermal vent metagenome TaxID=652676 RepID=A0A1W1CVN3_9ZZZZ
MQTFYYVHTGHRIGLDRFRRAVAILHALKDEDITLLTSDYRIAQCGRDFGINKSVGIDVVRNIPQIAQNGDKLIFDSDEANPLMLEDMRKYFSSFIRISDNQEDSKVDGELLISPYLEGEGVCHAVVVDDAYFGEFEKSVELTYFFGDDDYEKDLEKHLDFVADLDAHLQLGFYYFLDYEDMLKEKFPKYFEFEAYEDMIKKTKILLTASPQAVLDSLATGAKPIYFQREDYTKEFLPLFKELNIPIVDNYDKDYLSEIIASIDARKYEKIGQNSNKIVQFIKNGLNL